MLRPESALPPNYSLSSPQMANVGNKLIPGTQGAFVPAPDSAPQSAGAPANLHSALEERLAADVAIAEARREQSAKAIGVDVTPDKRQVGFRPTAIRQGKKVLARQKLASLRSSMQMAAEEVVDRAGIQNQAERAQKRIELMKQGDDIRFEALKSALELDKQITAAGLEQKGS